MLAAPPETDEVPPDVWFAGEPPREGHTLFWRARAAVRRHSGDPLRQDEWAMLIAHMECAQVFDDAGLAEWRDLLAPRPGVVHSARTMPDLCAASLHVGLWRDPTDHGGGLDDGIAYWAGLLTHALPNPCKGRAIGDDLAHDVVARHDTYDCVLRVLFGVFLGVLPGDTPAPFDVRIMCYAAFALHPPSPAQLARFVAQPGPRARHVRPARGSSGRDGSPCCRRGNSTSAFPRPGQDQTSGSDNPALENHCGWLELP